MQLAESNLRRATCAEQVAQSNLRRPTCTDQLAQSALPRATCAEQLAQSNLHRATCTEQLAQSNLQGATCTEQFAQSNLQGATCRDQLARSNLRRATCAEQLAQRNLRRATCADQLAPTSLRRAPCLVLARACFTNASCREKERIRQRWAANRGLVFSPKQRRIRGSNLRYREWESVTPIPGSCFPLVFLFLPDAVTPAPGGGVSRLFACVSKSCLPAVTPADARCCDARGRVSPELLFRALLGQAQVCILVAHQLSCVEP